MTLETFRFWDEYDWFSQSWAVVAREPGYFGGKTRKSSSFYYDYYEFSFSENRSGENELSNVRIFIILGSRERFNSFNKDTIDEKKYNEAFRDVYFLRVRDESQLSYL